jgi:hypothetical protein
VNHFKQHYPNFCEGFESEEKDFETIEELKEIETIKRWMADRDFHRLSLSSTYRPEFSQHCLMAELNGGKNWWVIGYLKDAVDLPKFDPPLKP